jgi:hypothetical protein
MMDFRLFYYVVLGVEDEKLDTDKTSNAQPPTWRTRVSFFVWNLTLDLSGMEDPASSYITTGIALEIMGSHKPSCNDKAETSLGGE